MTTSCDDVLTTLLLGRSDDPEVRVHLETCERCRAEAPSLQRVAQALAAGTAPEPPPALAAHVARAAAPLLERNARRVAWRAVAAALVPLPLVLLLDVWIVRTIHTLLVAVVPAPLGAYVVFNYSALLALLLALTYGAVPIVAARQLRPAFGGSHA